MKLATAFFFIITIFYSTLSFSMGDQPVCFVSNVALQPGTYKVGVISDQESAWEKSLNAAAVELHRDIPGKYDGVVFEYSFINLEKDEKMLEDTYTSVVLASDKANAIPSDMFNNKDIMFVESEFTKEAVKDENIESLINASKHILLGVSAVAGNDRKPMITLFTVDHLKQSMDSQAIKNVMEAHAKH